MKKLLLLSYGAWLCATLAHGKILKGDDTNRLDSVFSHPRVVKECALNTNLKNAVKESYKALRSEERLQASPDEMVFFASLLNAKALTLYELLVGEYQKFGDLKEKSALSQILGATWGGQAEGMDAAIYAMGDQLRGIQASVSKLKESESLELYREVAQKLVDLCSIADYLNAIYWIEDVVKEYRAIRLESQTTPETRHEESPNRKRVVSFVDPCESEALSLKRETSSDSETAHVSEEASKRLATIGKARRLLELTRKVVQRMEERCPNSFFDWALLIDECLASDKEKLDKIMNRVKSYP